MNAPQVEDEPMPQAEAGIALDNFRQSLSALNARKINTVTVLHVGDSHVAGDYMSQAMRQGLQDRYGNAGRALIGIPAYAYFRAESVRIAREGDWQAFNSLSDASADYGLSGVQLRSASAGDRLTVTTGAENSGIEFHLLRQPTGGRAALATAAGQRNVATRGQTGLIRARIPGSATQATLTAQGPDVSVLGVNLLSDKGGVRFVSLGIPGAKGDVAARWNETLMAREMAVLKPSLIVWSYGTNEGFNDDLSVEAHMRKVSANLDRITALAPGASLLIVGPPDAAREDGPGKACRSGWHVPPKLAPVRRGLAAIAAERKVAYWDWSAFMGGACSMDGWVKADLAGKDHVHFSPAGYEKAGQALLRYALGEG